MRLVRVMRRVAQEDAKEPTPAEKNRADILRAYRVEVYARRLDAIRDAAPTLRDLVRCRASVFDGGTPVVPDRTRAECSWPGCPRPRRDKITVCDGHQKQRERRGGYSFLTTLMPRPNVSRSA